VRFCSFCEPPREHDAQRGEGAFVPELDNRSICAPPEARRANCERGSITSWPRDPQRHNYPLCSN